jgi:CsoR family transcriptional regulator, copper-sensing transcriptional repressor
MSVHEHRDEVLRRMGRIGGQVRGIIDMIESDRPCPEVLTQMMAVRAALGRVATIILRDHMDNCLTEAVKEKQAHAVLNEIRRMLDQFVR